MGTEDEKRCVLELCQVIGERAAGLVPTVRTAGVQAANRRVSGLIPRRHRSRLGEQVLVHLLLRFDLQGALI